MAWLAIDRFCGWLSRRKELLVAVVGVAIEEVAGVLPGGSVVAKVLAELSKHGLARLLDRAADVPQLKPSGQDFARPQLDEIDHCLEKLTVGYNGLLDELEKQTSNATQNQDLTALIREALKGQTHLRQAFDDLRKDVQVMTFSLSRIEVVLGQFQTDFRDFLLLFPGYQEFQQLSAPDKQVILQATLRLRDGHPKQGLAILIASARARGVGKPTLLRLVDSIYPGEPGNPLNRDPASGAASPPAAIAIPASPQPLDGPSADSKGSYSVQGLDGHTKPVLSVAFSRKGNRCFSADCSGTVLTWDTLTGQKLRCMHIEAGRPAGEAPLRGEEPWRVRPQRVAFYNDGSALFCDANMFFYRGTELLSLNHPKDGRTLAFSANGEAALTVTDNGAVRMWNITKDCEVHRVNKGFFAPKHQGFVTCGALSACGKFAATGGVDRTVRLWDLSTGRQVHSWEGHTAGVTRIVFVPDTRDNCSPESQRLLSGCADGSVRLWEWKRGYKRRDGLLRVFLGHSTSVRSLACTPSGRRFLSGGGDCLPRWRLEGTAPLVIPLNRGTLRLNADPNDHVMIDCSVRLWDILSDKELAQCGNHTTPVTSVACSLKGGWVASGSSDGAVCVSRLPD